MTIEAERPAVRTVAGEVDTAQALRETLERRTSDDADYWSFTSSRRRSAGHGLFQYPAMMVPELQGALLDDVMSVDAVRSVYDPFMGSGTVLLESVQRGLHFYGTDINPLAVLLSQVKAEPPSPDDAVAAVASVTEFVDGDAEAPEHDFPFREKWFKDTVADALERVREGIVQVSDQAVRRYLWICMAETTRLVSNARTSTVKLHAYDAETLSQREPDVKRAFEMVTKRNLQNLTELSAAREALEAHAVPATSLRRGSVLDEDTPQFLADVIMTSPPYGDNQTTVTYGQHSYLPLQWIDHADLVGDFDKTLLASTHRIDGVSLGGSLRMVANARPEILEDSAALRAFVKHLPTGTQVEKKVIAFTYDYARALRAMSANLRAGGFIFLTLGQRRVSGFEMPLVTITKELLVACGFDHVDTLERKLLLSRRRMGSRNRQGDLMAGESVLIMRKRSGDEAAATTIK